MARDLQIKYYIKMGHNPWFLPIKYLICIQIYILYAIYIIDLHYNLCMQSGFNLISSFSYATGKTTVPQ